MSEQTATLMHAARNYRRWGRWATVRFCEKRGLPRRLLTLAVQLARIANHV